MSSLQQHNLKYWFECSAGSLRAYIRGEVDMDVAPLWRKALDFEITKNHVRNVVFDFSAVTFIDSSGLGVILGRYNNVAARGGRVVIEGVSPAVYKILILSGFDKIMRIVPAADGGREAETLTGGDCFE